MAFVGRLEDLGMAELFHMLSLFRKSGELRLRNEDRVGVFVFRQGKIVHATDDAARTTLGAMLVDRGHITEAELAKALELQRAESGRRRIGAILVASGVISRPVLEQAIRDQLQDIAEEYLHWTSGFFSFKSEEGEEEAEEPQSDGLELAGGMNTDQFILQIITRLDELGTPIRQDGAAEEGLGRGTPMPSYDEAQQADLHDVLDYMLDPGSYEPAGLAAPHSRESIADFSDLRSLMMEMQLRPPSFTGEITLTILRYASQLVNRGVLFSVDATGIAGIGQFGIDASLPEGVSASRRIRQIHVPCHEPSVFFEVLENMHTYRGPLKRSRWNLYLAEQLGGQVPAEVLAIPIVSDGMIIGILYGDNLPEGRPIGPSHGLELLIIEAGLAIEKRLLQAKLRTVEAQVRLLTEASRTAT